MSDLFLMSSILCRRVSSFYSPSSAEPAKARRSKVQQARKTKMMEVSTRSRSKVQQARKSRMIRAICSLTDNFCPGVCVRV